MYILIINLGPKCVLKNVVWKGGGRYVCGGGGGRREGGGERGEGVEISLRLSKG